MAVAEDVVTLATALSGTISAPHHDRTAFKVRRIYATLAADGASLNLMLTPEEQAFKILLAPHIYSRLPNAWGLNGATRVELSAIAVPELAAMLRAAWEHAGPKKPPRP